MPTGNSDLPQLVHNHKVFRNPITTSPLFAGSLRGPPVILVNLYKRYFSCNFGIALQLITSHDAFPLLTVAQCFSATHGAQCTTHFLQQRHTATAVFGAFVRHRTHKVSEHLTDVTACCPHFELWHKQHLHECYADKSWAHGENFWQPLTYRTILKTYFHVGVRLQGGGGGGGNKFLHCVWQSGAI